MNGKIINTRNCCLTGFIVAVLLSLFPMKETAHAGKELEVGRFSSFPVDQKRLPADWEPLLFKKINRHTGYELTAENGVSVIRAESNAAASGLIRKIRIDPEAFPLMQWRWKITGVYKKGDVYKKDGDDYPARIYIAFEYDARRVGFLERVKFGAAKAIYGEYPPVAAINYIWGSRAPVGTIVPNPYVDRVKMIVVESGESKSNTWVTEERNIYQDFLDIYGEAPPMISGVAIMTDSDNTGESAVSYYGDIIFKTND